MTDGDSRIDNERNIVKNMDDFFLYGCDEEELKKPRNLKLKLNKFIIGFEVESGGSILTMEKVKNQKVIFIPPKGKRIKAFE